MRVNDIGPYVVKAVAFHSDASPGTPPISVVSNTLVGTLNVDMVDGFHMDQAVTRLSSPTFQGLRITGDAIIAGTIPSIGPTAISPVQWGYLGALDQPLATTDSPTFDNLTVTGVMSARSFLDFYAREYDDAWQIRGAVGAADRYTLQTPNELALYIDGKVYMVSAQTDIDLSAAASWDATAPTDYTVAANRAGVDFYIYACVPFLSAVTPTILVSDNAVAPVGYTAANSRRVGGFHGLCVAVGAIGGHALTNFVAGDILPDSIWDYMHRPRCSPEGMVYSDAAGIWVDVYLASGIGANTASVYGAAIEDDRDWMDFVDDGAAVRKRLLHDAEFQMIAAGSNEETDINGGADPVTTGGHSDTALRRMISDIGCEDCCGVMWQWLLDQSYRYDGGDHAHVTTITHKGAPTGSVVQKDQAETNFNANLGSGADETVNTDQVDPVPAWAYFDLPGAKGSFYRQGDYGDAKLHAGAAWYNDANSGSRARDASSHRWDMHAGLGGRFCAQSR